MDTLENSLEEFTGLIHAQKFDAKNLSHDIAAGHITRLKQFCELSNSSILVFDLAKMQPALTVGFYDMMKSQMEEPAEANWSFLNQFIHPEDSLPLVRLWIASLRLAYSLPTEERKKYKMIFDYRVQTGKEQYTRIIEQHQVLELDPSGNIWLSLSFVDISPDQDLKDGVRYSIVNFKTGELIDLPELNKGQTFTTNSAVKLSGREKEILSLIKDGFLSKEIAEKLSLSVHTINTHRQRILNKLNANTSLEAIKYASELGIIE